MNPYETQDFTTNELQRLRNMLEEADIPFEYETNYMIPQDIENLSEEIIQTILPLIKGDRITCPNNQNAVFSVIENVFSYGAAMNRLEVMSKIIGDDPLGGFTAEEVFAMIKASYENKERQYMSESKSTGKLIDANAFWQSEVERCHGLPLVGTGTSNNVYLDSRLRAQPTIDLKDIWPHARWVRGHGEDSNIHFCSRCGKEAFNAEEDNELVEDLSEYCHRCGAIMDECEP